MNPAPDPLAWGFIGLVGIALLMLGVVAMMKGRARPDGREDRFHSLTKVAADAIITIDEHSTVLSFNQCAERMFGRPAETMIGSKLHVILPERYRALHDAGVARIVAKGGPPFGGHTKEFHALRKDGSEFPMELTVGGWTDARGRQFFVGIIRDITERKQLEDELRRLATTDPLTGIYNRRRFLELMAGEMQRAHRFRHPLFLIMLDIDYFKRVNDTYGHAAGDDVIKAMAQACTSHLRQIDIFGRVGGEEFAILLPELTHEKGLDVAERLRAKIEALTVETSGSVVRFTASMGVAALREGDQMPDPFLARADAALYRAKQAGRNRVEEG